MVLLGLLWVPFIHKLSAELYIYLQSVQAYISPPIAVCFIFGILWTRVNGQGAISSLLAGFVLGATSFIFEVLDKSRHYDSGAIRWLVDMNFLHYAIFMFCGLRGSAGRRKLHVSGARPEKTGWADLRDCR